MIKRTKTKEKITPYKKVERLTLEKRQRFSWSYSIFDKVGPFNSAGSEVILEDIFEKQRSLENFNFSQLSQQGSHFISIDQIATEARKRLSERNLDDYEELFSFRFSGKERLFCIQLQEGLMGVLWWDPEHKICPTEKKYT